MASRLRVVCALGGLRDDEGVVAKQGSGHAGRMNGRLSLLSRLRRLSWQAVANALKYICKLWRASGDARPCRKRHRDCSLSIQEMIYCLPHRAMFFMPTIARCFFAPRPSPPFHFIPPEKVESALFLHIASGFGIIEVSSRATACPWNGLRWLWQAVEHRLCLSECAERSAVECLGVADDSRVWSGR